MAAETRAPRQPDRPRLGLKARPFAHEIRRPRRTSAASTTSARVPRLRSRCRQQQKCVLIPGTRSNCTPGKSIASRTTYFAGIANCEDSAPARPLLPEILADRLPLHRVTAQVLGPAICNTPSLSTFAFVWLNRSDERQFCALRSARGLIGPTQSPSIRRREFSKNSGCAAPGK